MAQKLIKINTDHYVVVDDSKIEVGDWYIDDAKQIRKSVVSDEVYWQHRQYNREYMKITHSNIGHLYQVSILPLSLQEVKELIGEVDVEKWARSQYSSEPNDYEEEYYLGLIKGYNQALEDNKEKKYTEEDVISIVKKSRETGLTAEYLLLSIQPKTEWEVEIVDGKLKLKL